MGAEVVACEYGHEGPLVVVVAGRCPGCGVAFSKMRTHSGPVRSMPVAVPRGCMVDPGACGYCGESVLVVMEPYEVPA